MLQTREQKKKKLKDRMVEGGGYFEDDYYYEDDTSELERKWKKSRKNRRIAVILIIVLIILIAGAGYLLYRYHKYSDYDIVWEKELNEGSFVGMESFADNVLKYSHDGASYYDRSGNEVWVDSYDMKDPKAYIFGDYACIADTSGNSINIYNKSSGLTGTAKTNLPVTKAVVSSTGIVAAVIEDDNASYICFYTKDGSTLDISIKTTMAGDGYPLDISLSPEGTQLISSYSYLEGGQLKSKVVFYDFSEIGKNIPNRLVGGFEEPFADSMVSRVRFINDTYSYAVSDTGIAFFSSKNIASPELIRQAAQEQSVETVFHSDEYVGLVVKNLEGENPYTLILYKPDGTEALRTAFDFNYRYVSCDDQGIYFTDDDRFMMINLHGVVKYSGQMDELARIVVGGKGIPGRYVFSGSTYIREYQFR